MVPYPQHTTDKKTHTINPNVKVVITNTQSKLKHGYQSSDSKIYDNTIGRSKNRRADLK